MSNICALCRVSLDGSNASSSIPLTRAGKHLIGFAETLRLVSNVVCTSCNHSCQIRFDDLSKRYPRLRDDGSVNPEYQAAIEQFNKEHRERIHSSLLGQDAAYYRSANSTFSNNNTVVPNKVYSPRRSNAASNITTVPPALTPIVVKSPTKTTREEYEEIFETQRDVTSLYPPLSAGALNTTLNPERGIVAIAGPNPASVVESHRALIRVEREADQLREELYRLRGDLESARDRVEREKEEKGKLVSAMTAERDQLRDEYERRYNEMQEQLTVLKGMNESAAMDRARAIEDGESKKRHMMGLVETERKEKVHLLEEYRRQTENLLMEQGKEIEALRGLLETANAREKSLSNELHDMQQRRVELESQVLKWETQLMDERNAYHKKSAERESQHQIEVALLQEAKDKGEKEYRGTIDRLSLAKEQIQETLRQTTTQLETERMTYAAEREESRRHHERELEQAVRELREAKSLREKIEDQTHQELDRVTRETEELVISLRKELEQVRKDKQDQFDQARHTKESMMAEHHSRLQQMQLLQDTLRKELSDERSTRKDVESARQTAVMKLDQAQAEIVRLHAETERIQIEYRQQERIRDQEHQQAVEQFRAQVRGLESDLLHTKSQLKKCEDEVRHWMNAFENKENDIVTQRLEHRAAIDEARQSNLTLTSQLEETRVASNKALDLAQTKRLELEAELTRAQRLLDEITSKHSVASKNLTSEKRLTEQLQEDLMRTQQALEREKSSHQKSLNLLVEKDSASETLQRQREEALVALRESQKQVEKLKGDFQLEMRARDDAHRALVSEQRASEERYSAEISSLQDQLRLRNNNIMDQERVISQHRDALSRLEVTLREHDTEYQRRMDDSERRHQDELARMEALLQVLKEDVTKANAARFAAQRDATDRMKDLERHIGALQDGLDNERAGRARATDDLRVKEHLNSEHQGTIRMLTSRLQSRDDEVRKLELELQGSMAKYQECTLQLGRKDSQVHQLMARIRALECRTSLNSSSPGSMLQN